MKKLLALGLACAACGNISPASLTATRFVSASLVSVPSVSASGVASPAGAAATVFFGDIDTAKAASGAANGTVPSDALTPRAGATLTLTWADKSVKLADNGGGSYGADSTSSMLAVAAGTEYTLTIVFSGDTYTAKVTPGAAIPMTNFASSPVAAQAQTADFVATRSDGGGTKRAFLTVAKLDPSNPTDASNVTFTTAPHDAISILEFALGNGDPQWTSATITAPHATAFPAAGNYLATLMSAAKGTTSDNLFAGSVFLGLTGSAGGLKVQ